MSGFSLDWLRQREPFDLAARDRGCAQRFAATLAQVAARPLRILDLASGSGASLRALAPVIGVDQVWTLTDNDADLVSAQAAVAPHWRMQSLAIDLARDLDVLDLAAFDGVTTSAFLDLVSQAWLDRFAAKLAAAKLPLLAALSVDGRRIWHPPLPDDATVLAAFARHQSSDKGFGPALGAAAVSCLAGRLRRDGYAVSLARSDWRIGRDAVAMLRALLDETSHAACEARPDQANICSRWLDVRRVHLECGVLSLEVGHLDLLALPPGADTIE